MRSDVTEYSLAAPPSLEQILERLSSEPGAHIPLAGGTELMVALNTGRLQQRSLLSIQHLRELRFVRVEGEMLHIGSGTTFNDIRKDRTIANHLPLLAESASWTGSVANQNRATLGGNICNASPAADTPPVLLAYDATLTLVCARGTRTLPYVDFHLGYKQTALRPDELLHTISVPLRFSGYKQYVRKVGTRRAQAISKIALAAVIRMEDEVVADIRLAAASLADRPIRCVAAEATLMGKTLTEETIRAACGALTAEAKPIDDIRSTRRYRSAVAANLLEMVLRSMV